MTEKTYSNFDELFNDVSRNVDNYYSGDSFIQRLNKEILNCYFNDWLQEVKGFKYSNAEEYKAFLNKKTMLEYLEYEGEQESIRLVEAEKEKESWQPQQPKVVKPNEVKKELHNHIFKGNAFEVWQSMFDSFEITESSRTDLRFMYEVMKYNKQIQDTITVKNITDWINEFYNFSIDKLHYTAINSKSNSKRMNIYNLIKQGT